MQEFTLRPYQELDVQEMINKRRMLNCNEPGLGKTLETLSAANALGTGKVLIISPKIATGVWLQEAKQWFDWEGIVLTGDVKPAQRKLMLQDFVSSNKRFLACNTKMLKEVIAFIPTWETIIADEIHLLGLLNEKTATYKQFKQLKSTNMYLLTGTPIRQGPQDLYAPLSLINASKFKSYWAFVNRYCMVQEGPFGKQILGRPKDPLRFKQMVQCYMIRHLKKDVLADLPDKQRECVPLELTKEQQKAYNQIMEDMMLEVGDDLILTPGALTQTLRLRQLLVCPRILGVEEDGAALEALTDYYIPEEFSNNRSVVVATVFKTAVPFIKDAIRHKIPGVQIFEIHGGQKESAASIAQRFQQCDKIKKVLIFTIKSGASWTAHSASTAFFLGYEWSCIDNLQAEDRIHRIGQKNKVQIKYLLHTNTVDEIVRDKLDNKNMAANWIFKPEEIIQRRKLRQEEYKRKKR